MSENATYRSLAEGLPPEMAGQLHPNWYKNEANYWANRDGLLEQFKNEWIGFSNGKVITSGTRPVQVLHAAKQVDPYAFFACVGREYEPYRMRRTVLKYDTKYMGEPLPIVSAGFRHSKGVPGILLDKVILDTGSDTSALPLSDCQQLQLNPPHASPAFISGVSGTAIQTLQFDIWIVMDGTEYSCQLNIDSLGNERILGRDVLNSMDVLFRGPAAEVIINP